MSVSLLQKAIRAVTPKPPPWKPSPDFLRRVRAGYLFSLEGQAVAETGSIWTGIEKLRADVHAALVEGSSELGYLLGNPHKTNLYYGVDSLCREYVAEDAADTPEDEVTKAWINSFAQMLGAVRMPNPEAKKNKPDLSISAALDALSETLGFDVYFPAPWPVEVGVWTSHGMVTYRAVHSLYQASKIREQCAFLGGNTCLEIGAGMGRVAYYAWCMGLKDYTIVDLPLAHVGQACFLAATIGEDNVCLPGEDRRGVKLLTPAELLGGDRRFDVALNADSLTEMSREYAEAYLAYLKKNAGVLISINHEINKFRVRDLLQPTIRSVYPLRGGYAEELFYFRPYGVQSSAPSDSQP